LVANDVPDSWPWEQLAAVLRRLGSRKAELGTLEEYVAACGDREVPGTVVAKIAKARIANGLPMPSAPQPDGL
jgi:hypothetical protein